MAILASVRAPSIRYNEAERASLVRAHGNAIMDFLSLQQKRNETLYAFAMRICLNYRIAYPHENPMNSLACKEVFRNGMLRDILIIDFPFDEMVQNATISFKEMYQWVFLFQWLETHKYGHGPNILSLNPPSYAGEIDALRKPRAEKNIMDEMLLEHHRSPTSRERSPVSQPGSRARIVSDDSD